MERKPFTDNGGKRSNKERRCALQTAPDVERRSAKDRRSGQDRRRTPR